VFIVVGCVVCVSSIIIIIIIIMMMIMIFINSTALSKIRCAAGTYHSVLMKRCAFRRYAKVAVDSSNKCSSAGKLFQVSGPETAKFLRPMAVAVRCTSSLPEAINYNCVSTIHGTTVVVVKLSE